jgi:DNA-binding LacI/PurR family transcriptional regulator
MGVEREREVTIRDVALLAQVSVTTVSNLLNGRDRRMRPETRDRVVAAMNELGFRPSRLARQLRTGQGGMVGLVVPSVANPFWGGFARAVEAEALTHGLQVLLCNSERDPVRERAYVDELWATGVRTVVLGSSPPRLDHLQAALDRGLRLVAVDREPQAGDPPTLRGVSIDNEAGARAATDHLLELGHRRIGFLTGPVTTISRRRRLAGYQAALAQADVDGDERLVWEGGVSDYGGAESAELGRAGMAALLKLDDPPTAVVTVNDMYAIGACTAVRDAGRDVPDVSVVGFDGIVLAVLHNPPLTTVRQPLIQLARLAIELLRAENAESKVVRPELVIRQSTRRVH